jgi:hypothetical protein
MLPDDHLDVQGQLLRALGGEANVFIKDSFVPWGLEGCFVEPSYDPYSFHVVREKGNNEWAFLVYDVPEDGIYYITWEDYSVGITYSNGFVGDDQFFQLGDSLPTRFRTPRRVLPSRLSKNGMLVTINYQASPTSR